ncbi:MAG: cupin domain-containing protein [Methanomicrobiales archaeon]|nr:cupin domain-containing protein [Methanomicrobiales archaeon]
MKQIPDALQSAPGAYRLVMENGRVRVLDLHLKPGEIAPMHHHPNDHVVYVMKNARFKLTFPDGKSDEFDLKAGQAVWLEAGSHATENTGTSEGHNIVVELKK